MHIIYDEEGVPNVKHKRVVEEVVSLSQPETDAVPPDEEEVPVPQGPSVVVPLGEEVPSEEEEVPAPLSQSRHRAPCRGPAGGRGGPSPPCCGPTGGRGGPSPLIMVPLEGWGCLVSVPPLVSSSPFFFFLKNAGDSSCPFFS
jgi:hypothetical protein